MLVKIVTLACCHTIFGSEYICQRVTPRGIVEKHTFGDIPKNWKGYIRAFLFHKTAGMYAQTNCTCLRQICTRNLAVHLELIQSQSMLFYHRTQVVILVDKRPINGRQEDILKGRPFREIESHFPGGSPEKAFSCSKDRMCLVMKRIECHYKLLKPVIPIVSVAFWKHFTGMTFAIKMHFTIQFHKKFQLNITVNEINIHYFYNSSSCLPSFSLNITKEMLFCGRYSNGSIFPLSKRHEVTIILHAPSGFIDIVVSVFDHNVVHNIAQKVAWPLPQPEWQVDFPQIKHSLYSYYLCARSFEVLQLNISGDKSYVDVYDGPSIMSTKLSFQLISNFVLTVSFQCTIHIWEPSTHESRLHYVWFEVRESISLQNSVRIRCSSSRKFDLPKQVVSNSSLSLYQLNLTVDLPSRINISINNLRYEGLQSATCKYSGLAFFDQMKGE